MESESHMHILGQLYECSHCNQTGTCTVSEGGNSCYHCVKNAKVSFHRRNSFKGKVVCGICGGVGITELISDRMKIRTPPIIAFTSILVFPIIIMLSILIKSEHTNQIVTFSGTMLGMIFTYFFTRRNQ